MSIYLHFSAYRPTVRPAPFVGDAVFFHCIALGFFVKYQVYIGVWEFLRVFKSIPLITLSVSIQIPCSIYYYISVELLDIRDGDSSRGSFIVQDCFSYLGLLFIHLKLRIALSRPQKSCVEILMGSALHL